MQMCIDCLCVGRCHCSPLPLQLLVLHYVFWQQGRQRSTLLGLDPSSLRFGVGPVQLDPAAALLILLLTAILVKGTRESSIFNMGELCCAVLLSP